MRTDSFVESGPLHIVGSWCLFFYILSLISKVTAFCPTVASCYKLVHILLLLLIRFYESQVVLECYSRVNGNANCR